MQQPDKKKLPNNQRELNLALGQSKTEVKWKNRTMTWAELLDRLSKPTVTQETVAEYQKMAKSKKDAIKDVGGFVGGFLKEGKRKKGNAQSRSLLTLDADSPRLGLWEDFTLMDSYTAAVYSTHSHTPEKPRLRFIIPLKRPVTAEEYTPLALKVAEGLGLDNFDDTTYQAERLMFWPSKPQDGEFVFETQEGDWLDPDEVLAQYPDWRDVSYWPELPGGKELRERQAKRQGDPLEKKGVVGAFCRTYDIHAAIAKFLSDVYGQTDHDDRYTFLSGSTSGGMIVYDDKFAYSHHGTDPVGDTLVNAFDLVRIHLFGDLDDEAKDGTPANRLPSFGAMRDFALDDEEVKATLARDRMAGAMEDFGDLEDDEWQKKLEFDKDGEIASSAGNLELIMKNDENLKDRILMDDFAKRLVVRGDLPWREVTEEDRYWKDADGAGLRVYIEKVYGIVNRGKVEDAFMQEAERQSVHPVREYLDSLEWDGVKRVDKLLIDYLGAEDTAYTRLVTRKFLTAAVARIYEPGAKFDYMLVTSGPQGIGKTELPTILAGKWFSNSLENVQGKDAYEALQGVWIMEMGEMTATKKADIEATKHFISKREDIYREAYGRYKIYFKRQCVFWGTSNDPEFLRDRTGNRRFWPVSVGLESPKLNMWQDLTEGTRGQIWAEAKRLYEDGERLQLTGEEEELAREQQALHTESNALEGMIQDFLEIPITEDWYTKTPQDRREYFSQGGEDFGDGYGEIERQQISVMEIWVELLKGDPKNLVPVKAAEIRSILNNMDGWEKYGKGRGRLKFGTGYGLQTAYLKANLVDTPKK